MSQLADIEARRRAYMRGDTSQQTIFEIVEDGAHLLALAREQAAKLDAVQERLDGWAALKPFPDAEESQRWYSLGKRHAADAIRTALEATK